MGYNGYGRDGCCGPETTGGELMILTWPGRWHTGELPVVVHGPVGAAAATGANPIVAAAAAMASGAR